MNLGSHSARGAAIAAIAATALAAIWPGPAGAQHPIATRPGIDAPPGFRGFDLTITPIRSHGGACADPTLGCTVGRFIRDQDQRVVQLIADDGEANTVARIGIWNWQSHTRRIRIRGAGSTRSYRVRYYAAGQEVTSAVVGGTYRTPRLRPGTRSALRLVVTMRRWVRNGTVTTFPVRTVPQYTVAPDGTRTLIPGDRVRDAVESYPYDAIPAIPAP